MDDFDKRVRRDALKLIAMGVAIGLLIGLPVGATVAYYSIDRVAVIPLSEGIKT
jgi:hypothetical protein